MDHPKTYMTKAEHARQHIQEMVLSGRVGPGDRITTREVSLALGISETPIREAIRSLASDGWLEVQNHIGAVVQGLRAEQIREISALRGLICGLAVELGAGNFNAERLAKMKSSSVLINTARGPLVDEAALIEALRGGSLRAAGLDVFEVEPLPTDSPLLELDNVLLSGHVAGLDIESHEGTFEMVADTIVKLHAGEWPADRIVNMQGVTDWTW